MDLNPYFYRTNLSFDVKRLRSDVHAILKQYPSDVRIFGKGQYCYDRISLVHRPEITDPLEKVYLSGRQGYLGPIANESESDFSVFNEEFRGMYIHDVYRAIEENTKKLGRLRIMRLNPKDKYIWHRDKGERYHIAIDTHPSATLTCSQALGQTIVNPIEKHIPADGSVWYLNTDAMHVAANPAGIVRYHLVFNVAFDIG
jgi:hypothetical protein